MTTLTRQQSTNLRLYYSLLVMLQQQRGGIRHSRSKGEYIYNANGRRVPEATIQKRLNTIVEDFQDNANRLGDRLDSGNINIAQYQERMRRELKDLYRTQHIVGRGGVEEMAFRDYGRLGQSLREQYNYLDRMAISYADGDVSLAQLKMRSKIYMEGSQKQFWQGATDAKTAAGFTQEQRLLGSTDHCQPCKDLAALGKQPIGTIIDPPGGCEGFGRCGCRKVYFK